MELKVKSVAGAAALPAVAFKLAAPVESKPEFGCEDVSLQPPEGVREKSASP
eukprot:CAMPEP_0178374164 /NCGR_PEP_ID=MMETSP0689_2-20121128/2236_1 /TAXON_ID=160604 /ORGANISM="Amphidinium massartii, Strain CS-259" /LENGTH=51 /DNA_ID=CAMNT_0019994127 /DNA_START=470 /DNA_END=625 /DNA_ORIENTATION=-